MRHADTYDTQTHRHTDTQTHTTHRHTVLKRQCPGGYFLHKPTTHYTYTNPLLTTPIQTHTHRHTDTQTHISYTNPLLTTPIQTHCNNRYRER